MIKKEAKKTTIKTTILFIIFGMILGGVAAFLYSSVSFFAGMVYFKILFAILIAGFLFFLIDRVIFYGEIRNQKLMIVFGTILFLGFVYWHFFGYAYSYVNTYYYGELFSWELFSTYLFDPYILFHDDVPYLLDYGTWTFKGEYVTGAILGVFWVIEHLLVLAACLTPAFLKRTYITGGETGGWMIKKKLPLNLKSFSSLKTVEKALKNGDSGIIEQAEASRDVFDMCVCSYYTDRKELTGKYFLEFKNTTPDTDENDTITVETNREMFEKVVNALEKKK